MPELYEELAGEWLLLEVLEQADDGSPRRLGLHGHHRDKEVLHERMMELDDWSWNRRFLLVKADPDRCELGWGSWEGERDRR